MHFQKTILWLFSSFLVWHVGASGLVLERADSIYRHMTDLERLEQLIWIRTTPERTLHFETRFGGVYYEAPLEMPIAHREQTVAVQLDERLNPMVQDLKDLPDLYTLAALSEEALLNTYFHFLKTASKERGIDHLVLPSVDGQSEPVADLINRMHGHDPDFYMHKRSLSFSKPKKKKEVMTNYLTCRYWVMTINENKVLAKRLDRYSSKIMDEIDVENRIKQSLVNQLQTKPEELSHLRLPNQLAVAISKASIIPLQRKLGLLPLTRDTVCFLTDEPYGKTANMMRNYAYVITEYDDIALSTATIVVDNGVKIPAGILSLQRTVIFIGEIRYTTPIIDMIDGALLYSHDSDIYTYVIPQQLFGATGASGKMPFDNSALAIFNNEQILGMRTLGYAPADMTGLDEKAQAQIEEIMVEAITSRSTPGGQLAIAVDGAIVLNEAYGYLTYDSLIPVDRSTLYDLASVTKVTATLLAVMKLYEVGKLNLDKTISDYLPMYENTNKEDITLKALLAHNGGLRSYVPFWKQVFSPDFMDLFYYENEDDEKADKRSYGMKPNPVFMDSLKSWILKSSLIAYDSVPGYHYSDLGFMILHQIVEKVSGMPLDEYARLHFYDPMGLKRLAFNPIDKGFQLFEIAPTEYDTYFRDELVWGEVHDRNAAVFGGVSGHAGLFANANDLLVVFQAILQGGSYDGKQFLHPSTIAYFNQRYFPDNGRALGWDKMDIRRGNASHLSSDESFGHTGFTGTMVWADPSYNLIFVFLSNRIHPNSNNYQLIRKNIRTRIQDVVYEALLAKWMK